MSPSPTAPSLADFERLVEQAFDRFPPEIREACADLAIRVSDFATEEQLAAFGIEDPYELTGVHEGIPLTDRSVLDQPTRPDIVWLFRRPIIEEWIDRGDVALDDLVAHVLVHEIAHHFGWSDDAIARIAPWTD